MAVAEEQLAGEPTSVIILVVEDEAVIRLTICDELRELGATVVEAVSGDEAWAHLQVAPVDVVFTDHRMPGHLQGGDLASQILEHYPDVEVVMTSGYYDGPRLPVMRLQKPYNLLATARYLFELGVQSKARRIS